MDHTKLNSVLKEYNKLTLARRKEIADLIKYSDYSYEQIGKMYGITKQRVSKIGVGQGVARRKRDKKSTS